MGLSVLGSIYLPIIASSGRRQGLEAELRLGVRSRASGSSGLRRLELQSALTTFSRKRDKLSRKSPQDKCNAGGLYKRAQL